MNDMKTLRNKIKDKTNNLNLNNKSQNRFNAGCLYRLKIKVTFYLKEELGFYELKRSTYLDDSFVNDLRNFYLSVISNQEEVDFSKWNSIFVINNKVYTESILRLIDEAVDATIPYYIEENLEDNLLENMENIEDFDNVIVDYTEDE